MNGVFKVESVKEMSGFGGNPYVGKYSGSRFINHTESAISLLVRGTIDGVDTSFFSPSVIVTTTTGILNSKSMNKNSWFEQINEETQMYKGHEQFDNDSTPNFAISTPSKIVPRIKIGDELNISYKEKGEFNGTKTIKNIKIIK